MCRGGCSVLCASMYHASLPPRPVLDPLCAGCVGSALVVVALAIGGLLTWGRLEHSHLEVCCAVLSLPLRTAV